MSTTATRRKSRHGLSYHPDYRVWQSMRDRCFNEACHAFSDYGGRGITVCARWKDDPAAFFQDIGEKPSSKHEIDRKNNDAHYSCGKCDECVANRWTANVRWATRSENDRNRRSSRFVEFHGERRLFIELCEEMNMPKDTIAKRLAAGWSIEAAFSTPVRAKRNPGERAAWREANRKRPARPRIDEERRLQALALFAEGITYEQIAARVGVGYNTVARIVKRAGVNR